MARQKKLPDGLRLVGGRYYLDLYDPHGKRYRKSLRTSDLRLAKALLAKERERIFRKAHDLPTEDESVEAFVTAYLAEVKQRQSPDWWLETKRRIDLFFDHVDVARPSQVRRADIVRWREHRFGTITPHGSPISRGGVAKDEQVLRALFSWGVRVGRLRTSPFRDLPKLKPDLEGEIDYLDEDEIQELLRLCREPVIMRGRGGKGERRRERWTPLEAIVTVAIFLGLRVSEIVHLDWPDIDFERGEVIVRSKPSEDHRTKTRRARAGPGPERPGAAVEAPSGMTVVFRGGARRPLRLFSREIDMRCKIARDSLEAYHHGELPREKRGGLEAHLQDCPACRAALSEMDAVAAALARGRTPPVPSGFSERVLAAARRRQRVEVVAAWDLPRWWRQAATSTRIAAAAVLFVGATIGLHMGWTTAPSPWKTPAAIQADLRGDHHLDYLDDAHAGSLADSYMTLASAPNGEVR
ncbi:tyrosine-type recombinase/integrase [Planctomycetota bacterium]